MSTILGSNVTIMVKSMNDAIAFYRAIGLELKQRWDDHYAMLTASGITIGIHPASSQEVNSGTVSIGFMIEDIEEIKKILTTNSIDFTEEIDGKSGIYLHFKDPDGTLLYFVKPMWD